MNIRKRVAGLLLGVGTCLLLTVPARSEAHSKAVSLAGAGDCEDACHDCQKQCDSRPAGSARSDCQRACTANAAGCCAANGRKPPAYMMCTCG